VQASQASHKPRMARRIPVDITTRVMHLQIGHPAILATIRDTHRAQRAEIELAACASWPKPAAAAKSLVSWPTESMISATPNNGHPDDWLDLGNRTHREQRESCRNGKRFADAMVQELTTFWISRGSMRQARARACPSSSLVWPR